MVRDPAPGAPPKGAAPAALTLGCVALLMLGVQPAVLGALQSAGRLSVGDLAQAATVEFLSLGLVSGLMAAFVRHRRLRLWGLGACAGLIAANLAGLAAGGGAFVVTRGAAGVAGGVLVWIAVGVIGRHPAAARLAALFAGAQSVSQAALAGLLPSFAQGLGANAGLVALGACAAACLPLLLVLPSDLPDLPKPQSGGGGLDVRGVFGLASTFLLMAGIVGVWVFAEPLARLDGASAGVASAAIAASLAMQVVGAVVMVVIGPRAPPGRAYVAVSLAYIGVVAAMAWGRGDVAFMSAALGLGFLWNVALSLSTPLMIQVDPTRRAVMLTAGAQLLGGSAGPMITGAFASETRVFPVLPAAAALFALAAVSAALAIIPRRARAA